MRDQQGKFLLALFGIGIGIGIVWYVFNVNRGIAIMGYEFVP